MKPDVLDSYIDELRRELRWRGTFDARVVEEVRAHVADAVAAEERKGVAHDVAMEQVLSRFGPAKALAIDVAFERSVVMQKIILVAAIAIGVLIAYVDSRPGWDDTGVTAGAVLLTAGILGAVAPNRPWLWALCVGLWIPVLGILGSGNYASLIALAIAFAGAYAGMLVRRTMIAT